MKNQTGQALMEYMILAAFVVVGSLAIVHRLGNTVETRISQVNDALQAVEVSRFGKGAGDRKASGRGFSLPGGLGGIFSRD